MFFLPTGLWSGVLFFVLYQNPHDREQNDIFSTTMIYHSSLLFTPLRLRGCFLNASFYGDLKFFLKKKGKDGLERPSWDELFIATAVLGSSRGTCDRLRTSCVLVKNNRIIGSGYNGAVAGLKNCDDAGHLMIGDHCLRTLHGEDNAIANAVSSLDGATAYIIATPCLNCVKKLLQYGVKRIVYVGRYANISGIEYIPEICKEKEVSLEQWSADPKKIAAVFSKIFMRLNGSGGIFKDFNVQLLPTDSTISKASARMEKKCKKGN
ncbi:MAG: hypothetical protein UW28_C0037G0003 [Parcubacteria group bacterium GW2011_GWA2_44_13]|nr:MAG: hypothetical protein UW28_C0037G0003 [Parcubacteria group bacterium GW2011_GWA2_44_13]